MTGSFADLKRARKTSLETLISETSKLNSPGENQNRDDDNFWKPTVDKAGNGYAVIRFLPAPGGEDLPWVRVFNHGFQGPGGWYIENSLTTIGKKDPVSEHNSMLWNSGIESNKDIVRKQKRRLTYISNIYVVSDPAAPENEGKVFLYKFGKKIFDKINDMMNPQFQDESPVNPFDLWEGANFKLKIRNVEGYRNYDKSEFASASKLSDDDDKLEGIYNGLYALKDFTDPKNYKSYDELKAKLMRVLGENAAPMTTAESVTLDEVKSAAPMRTVDEPVAQESYTPQSADDEDDTLSYFKNLANS